MAKDAFVKSAQKEFSGWMKWSGVIPLTRAEAEKVFSDPKMKRRILRSRAAYRDKARGQGALQAKCPTVIIGCSDPDLKQLTRDSPTPSRLSEFVILSIAAAGSNKKFNGDNRRWFLWISDAAQAFLQGQQDESERSGPLFMFPPDDPIQKEAGAFPSPLYRIAGNAYGLSNAPRVWFTRVQQALLENEFVAHSFDKCFFMHWGADGLLDCLLIVHVDDFLAVCSETFNKEILQNLLEWGPVTLVDEKNPGTYRGKEITVDKLPDGRIHYKVSQKAFLENLAEGNLARGHLKQDDHLDDNEVKEFRSANGCIQWLGGQTRPELSSTASLCDKGSETKTSDLHKLHEAIKYAKATAESGIVFTDVPVTKASCLVTYTDSSWANAANYSSQFGVLVMLCPPQVTGTNLPWPTARLEEWQERPCLPFNFGCRGMCSR